MVHGKSIRDVLTCFVGGGAFEKVLISILAKGFTLNRVLGHYQAEEICCLV